MTSQTASSPSLDDPIYTAAHLALLFRCSRRAALAIVRRPGFPAPLGLDNRSYQFDPAEVHAWWRKQRGQLRPRLAASKVNSARLPEGRAQTMPYTPRRGRFAA